MILAGCSNSQPNQQKQSAEMISKTSEDCLESKFSPEQSKAAFDRVRKLIDSKNNKTVKEPWGLQYSDAEEKYLFIRPRNEADFYQGTDKLYNAFRYSLDWTEECTPEDKTVFDEYDYVFRTGDSYDVYLNSKSNVFYFEKDSKLYKLWPESSNLWNGIKFNKNSATADFISGELVFDSANLTEDLDGDGTNEEISLRIKSNLSDVSISPELYLVVNGKEEFLFSDAGSGIRTKPELHLLDSSSDSSKAVIINSAIKPADWDPVEEFYPYSYKNGKLLKLRVIKPDQRVKSEGKNVFVQYPQFNKKISFKVNDNTLRFYGEPKDIFSNGVPLYQRALNFKKTESRNTRLITVENGEMFKGGYYFTVETVYAFEDGELVPKSLRFIDRPY